MTTEKAIEILKLNGWGFTDGELKEATLMATDALAKRTAIPPKQNETKGTSLFGEAICPICGNLIFGTEKFCSECGQAIDWSEVE